MGMFLLSPEYTTIGGEASSKFSTKSRVCYYRGDIDEIFLCCQCQKVALGVVKGGEEKEEILEPIYVNF